MSASAANLGGKVKSLAAIRILLHYVFYFYEALHNQIAKEIKMDSTINKMSRRKFLTFSAASIGVGVLVACAPAAAPAGGGAGAPAAAKKTITYWDWWGPAGNAVLKNLFD